ncbi:MAG: hypothetical protein Q4D62_15980 [Planctomycetia bacterium]|nr:hypothetical protein [Planctomycetia bacterium]
MIYSYAGVLGVDPGKFTLRELVWMVKAKTRYDWGHSSALMATQINCHIHGKIIPLDAFVPKEVEDETKNGHSSEVVHDHATKKEVGRTLQRLFPRSGNTPVPINNRGV